MAMATAACTSLLGSTALEMKTQGVRQGSQGRGKLTQQRVAGEEGRSAAGQREKCTGWLAEKKEDRRQRPRPSAALPQGLACLQETCFPVLDGKPTERQSGLQLRGGRGPQSWLGNALPGLSLTDSLLTPLGPCS